MNRERNDYPLCPYCRHKVVGFNPPGRPQNQSIYCSNAECRGRSITGIMNGYNIRFSDLKSPVSHEKAWSVTGVIVGIGQRLFGYIKAIKVNG